MIKSYLESSDEDGTPYFSQDEKLKFLNEWKIANKEQVKESLPIFSTASFNNKDLKQQEYERLLALIKDPREKHDIERHASIFSKVEDKIKFLERYFEQEEPTFRQRAENINEKQKVPKQNRHLK